VSHFNFFISFTVSCIFRFSFEMNLYSFDIVIHSNSDYEIEVSDDPDSSTIVNETAVLPKKAKIKSLKSKRRCTFNTKWLKDPVLQDFLRQYKTNKYFAHCSICK